jgi:hypothetical protein
MPSEAGILKGRVRDSFRRAVKPPGLKKVNAEADFFFIWGYLGFALSRRSAHFAKDRHLLSKGESSI